MAAIFISYRRDDSKDETRRIAEKLAQRFGNDAVFLDVEAIDAGADFSKTILDGVRAASVMIVVIGPQWLKAQFPRGTSRLNDPEDFVRREIETALDWRVPIVPVLVDNASMPVTTKLPSSIRKLSLLQAFALNEPNRDEDIARLADVVANTYKVEPLPIDSLKYFGGRVQNLRRYPISLATLVLRPKRFLATRALGQDRNSVDAFVFLVVSTPLAVWLAIAEWPGQSWLLLVSGASVNVMLTLLLSLPLYLAWRAAGADREYGRVLTILFYQSSVFYLGVGLNGLMLLAAVNLTDPRLLPSLKGELEQKSAAAFFDDAASALFTTTSGTVVIFPYVLAFDIALLLWMIASWGAYRRALGLSRIRSSMAFALTLLFVAVPILFSILTAVT